MQVIRLEKEKTVVQKNLRLQENERVVQSVADIIEQVKVGGDKALVALTKQFDGATVSSFLVTKEEIETAYRTIRNEELDAIKQAIKNVTTYHEEQINTSWMQTKDDGTLLGQKVTPLDAVGFMFQVVKLRILLLSL